MKEFHLYLYSIDTILTDYNATLYAIKNGDCRIDTTQVILCTTELFKLGYRIFVHQISHNSKRKCYICMIKEYSYCF